jgi:transcriptional regulator with XRE-family HTH domain
VTPEKKLTIELTQLTLTHIVSCMRTEPGVRPNGAAIRAIRIKDRRSVADVARYAGLKTQSLRNIELGQRDTTREVITLIAEILDVPVEAITRDGTDPRTADEEAPEIEAQAA